MTDSKAVRARKRWAIGMVAISYVALAVVCVLFTNHAVHESERKWCGIVVLFDNTNRETPPSTETGRKLAERMAQLRKDFGCD